MRSITISLVIPFISLLLFVAGCGEHSPYKVVMVKGNVLVDGQPMAGITVTFSPTDPSAGHAAGGTTNATGNFTLTTAGLKVGKGAVAGKYNVLFAKERSEAEGMSAEELTAKFNFVPPRMIRLIPARYSNTSKSGIEPVVVDSNPKLNEFKFELTTEGLEKDNTPPPPPKIPQRRQDKD